jgi:P27 family predicted phage terminase small subunit
MRPGPKPRPTHLKVLDGIRDSRVNRREPLPAPGPPEPPAYLAGDELDAWHAIVEATPPGTATASDVIALAVFAQRLAEFRRSSQLASVAGPLVVDERGQPRTNPACRIAREAGRDLLRWCAEFGMTPSARSTLVTGRDPAAYAVVQRYLTP